MKLKGRFGFRTWDARKFLVCAVLCIASFVFILKMVPETRGKTLEEIQHEWEA
jgi:hypothetical protein